MSTALSINIPINSLKDEFKIPLSIFMVTGRFFIFGYTLPVVFNDMD